LWLHGSTGSSRTAPACAGAHVLSYDRPGFGGSSPHESRTLDTDALDVEALLDAHHLASVPVLAFSGGAAVAYAFATRAPDRVSRLGIVSGATPPTTPPPTVEALDDVATSLASDPDAAVAALAVDAAPLDLAVLSSAHHRRRLIEGARDAVRTGTRSWIIEALTVRNQWPRNLHEVRCRVILWHGRHDRAVPVSDAETTATLLPSAELRISDEAGHLGWLAVEQDLLTTMLSR
jgi:pimeloyl-ACP methyl ester carboxylesterase